MDFSRTTTSSVATRFFLVALLALGTAASITTALAIWNPPQRSTELVFPAAFFTTTLMLIFTSTALHYAVRSVRRERQTEFRRGLLLGMISGTLFVGVQGYGLNCFLKGAQPPEAQLGARPFLFVFAAMHCLHVFVALLFLSFVVVRAYSGRYDHEYDWGPLITGWFWHGLGVVWLVLLAVIGAAAM